MNILSLSLIDDNKLFFFNQFNGSVYYKILSNNYKKVHNQIPEKVVIALNNNDNPYLLAVNDFQKENFPHNSVKLNKYIYRLSLLCDKSFYLAKLYSNYRSKDFENSTQAIEYFKSIEHLKEQNTLCLPRTLFAASKSKLFKEKGVIFIGIFLPATTLHAWIIEDGCQPDREDIIWTNYQPIAAIY
jgi:hypothetical protein